MIISISISITSIHRLKIHHKSHYQTFRRVESASSRPIRAMSLQCSPQCPHGARIRSTALAPSHVERRHPTEIPIRARPPSRPARHTGVGWRQEGRTRRDAAAGRAVLVARDVDREALYETILAAGRAPPPA